MAACSFCGAKITPNQEETSIALFDIPVCSKIECEKRAQADADKATEAWMTPRDKIRALLARRDFKEQSVPGFFLRDDGSTKLAVNLNKMSKLPGDACPEIGVLQPNGDITEEGHGITRVADIRSEIKGILKSKGASNEKKETSAVAEEIHEEKHNKAEARKDETAKERETEKPEAIFSGNVIAIFDKYGWKISGEQAMKEIDGSDVVIALSRIEQRGKAVLIAGSPYQHGLHEAIDAELKILFGELLNSNAGKKETSALASQKKSNPVIVSKPSNGDFARPKPDAVLPVKTYTARGTIIKGFVPQLAETGKIKIGRKGEKTTSSGYRLPEKFDHFEIVGILRDENGNLIPDQIMCQLGANPKELNVFLLYNDPTLNFPTRYNAYKGGKCICRGDGEKALASSGDEIVCNPDTCLVFKDKGCKLSGILSCVLADSPILGGVYKFRTTSHNSIRSILSSLMFISTLTGGVLSMIPLKLTVSPKQVQPRDSQTVQTIYVVNVVFPGTIQQLLEATVKVSQYQSLMRAQIHELENTARQALSAPESEEEMRDFQDEFMFEKEVTT